MNKEWMAFFIGVVTMVGGFYSLIFLPDAKVGVVTPLMTFVLGYYFGSSPGSHDKDQTISDLALTTVKHMTPKLGVSNGGLNGVVKEQPCPLEPEATPKQ